MIHYHKFRSPFSLIRIILNCLVIPRRNDVGAIVCAKYAFDSNSAVAYCWASNKMTSLIPVFIVRFCVFGLNVKIDKMWAIYLCSVLLSYFCLEM